MVELCCFSAVSCCYYYSTIRQRKCPAVAYIHPNTDRLPGLSLNISQPCTDESCHIFTNYIAFCVFFFRTVERSRLKCGQYWPMEEDGVEEYGDFIVINNGMDHRENYTLTSLILQNTKVCTISHNKINVFLLFNMCILWNILIYVI